ncbi:DUF6463 family protein [Nocardia puris]|uniref:Uncharacterized protein n=1 Tax=Nocardia puris TaxID=208602 RepID=A0A366D9W1_9NOCA|nr:DUF6463 family protein [Nocardia puris]RBO86847.1 hypothetical protein DFR74_11219 [Nocardia puris]
MVKWAGGLIVFIGVAHTLIALALTAPSHAGAWIGRELWGEKLAEMSSANGAYWLTLGSFGIPLAVVGFLVLWMDRRGLTPPTFIAWTLVVTTIIDLWFFGPSPGPILLIAAGLLLAADRRAKRAEGAVAAAV